MACRNRDSDFTLQEGVTAPFAHVCMLPTTAVLSHTTHELSQIFSHEPPVVPGAARGLLQDGGADVGLLAHLHGKEAESSDSGSVTNMHFDPHGRIKNLVGAGHKNTQNWAHS